MNTPSPILYDLVKQLTKSEKRYIKVQAGNSEKDYIQLMDALIEQKTFDEEKLLQEYQDSNFTKHLAVNKRYLYELILRSLSRFRQNALEDKTYAQISAAKILIEKGLFKAAAKELKKGQKIATKYELFELQIMLCGLEKQLLFKQQKRPDAKAINHIFNTEQNCLRQLSTINEYWYLAHQILHFQTRFQKVQNQEQKEFLENLSQSPKFHQLELATNFKSKLFYFQAKATYYFMLGDVKQAYGTNRAFLDLLDRSPNFLHLYAERYLATLNNILIDSLIIGDYDLLEAELQRLTLTLERAEFKSIKNIESRVFRQRYLLLLNWSINQKDFGRALELVPEIEAGLQQFGKKIEKHHRITFYYLTAYLLFLNQKYDQALHWNNYMLNDPKEDVVKEIFYFARVLNLLIHFELGNHTLLESLLFSTPKYIKSKRPLYATEMALFRFLNKLLKAIDKSARAVLYTDFKNEIEELAQAPKEKRMFSYLDLSLWLEK